MINYLFNNPISFFIYILALFFAITIHEFSHAFMADYLGDPTARLQGRLKLDPRVHIDLYGLLFLFFFGFGWGKPVPFDPFNLKNPRKDSALISLAGPISNFICALILALILRLFIFFKLNFLLTIGYFLFLPFIQLNLILGLFNLLPIHPLDGFKIVGGFLSENQAREWYQLERYGFIFLLMLIFPFGNYSMIDILIRPTFRFLLNLFVPSLNSGVI